MNNTKGLCLRKSWWEDQDHQLPDTPKLRASDRKAFISLIAKYENLGKEDTRQWPELLKVLDKIFIAATNLHKQCPMTALDSKKALKKAAAIAQKEYTQVIEADAMFRSYQAKKWADIRKSSKDLKDYCRANYEEESYEFLSAVDRNGGVVTAPMLESVSQAILSAKDKMALLEQNDPKAFAKALQKVETSMKNNCTPDRLRSWGLVKVREKFKWKVY